MTDFVENLYRSGIYDNANYRLYVSYLVVCMLFYELRIT